MFVQTASMQVRVAYTRRDISEWAFQVEQVPKGFNLIHFKDNL